MFVSSSNNFGQGVDPSTQKFNASLPFNRLVDNLSSFPRHAILTTNRGIRPFLQDKSKLKANLSHYSNAQDVATEGSKVLKRLRAHYLVEADAELVAWIKEIVRNAESKTLDAGRVDEIFSSFRHNIAFDIRDDLSRLLDVLNDRADEILAKSLFQALANLGRLVLAEYDVFSSPYSPQVEEFQREFIKTYKTLSNEITKKIEDKLPAIRELINPNVGMFKPF